MNGFSKYYQKDQATRLEILKQQQKLTKAELEILNDPQLNFELGDTMIENYLTQYQLPEGLALNYVIDGKEYLIPMVTEEPSVIAAASHGASIVKRSGGFKSELKERLMIGQIVVEQVKDTKKLARLVKDSQAKLLQLANAAHPSIVKRGGGAREIKVRILASDLVSIDLIVDVKEAMGANMLNTMLEACAAYLRNKFKAEILLSILSNYATRCLVKVTCAIPVSELTKKDMAGEMIAQKIATASRLAKLDPYRATTHNKGIMNGIDAVVIASGNDWRAVEAGAHAYAARHGSYQGLSTWEIKDGKLIGSLELPLPLATVGGSIAIVPLVKVNQRLLDLKDAEELEKIVAAVGLGQNLAALYALVTEGIQKGHMKLQLKSLAVAVGARPEEVAAVVDGLLARQARDSATATQILEEIRGIKREEK